jgi:ketosteroid isomerase-like protein
MTSTTHSSTLGAFYRLLDQGDDIDGLVRLFTEDAAYIRPAIDPSGKVLPDVDVVKGHVELRRYFEERGRRPYRHVIRSLVREGKTVFVEGVIEGTDNGSAIAFLATATTDSASRVIRLFGVPLQVSSEGMAAISQ